MYKAPFLIYSKKLKFLSEDLNNSFMAYTTKNWPSVLAMESIIKASAHGVIIVAYHFGIQNIDNFFRP